MPGLNLTVVWSTKQLYHLSDPLHFRTGHATVAFSALKKRLSSKARVVEEGEDGFDQARQVWNRAIDRRPRWVMLTWLD